MNKKLLLIILWTPFTLNAEEMWQCTTRDATNKEWVGASSYQRSAMSKAFEACKKESTLPLSCQSLPDTCDSLTNDTLTNDTINTISWKCIALDQLALPWESNYYRRGDDAALAAKAYCQQHSALPATCYVNMLACQHSGP